MGELQGISQIKLHNGRLDEFKALCAQFMEIVRTQDTGTLQFEIHFNDDESECIVVERYEDSEALMEHGAHIGELAGALPAMGEITSACLGKPSAVLAAQLAGSPVQLFRPYLSLHDQD